jgi:Mor family transcriptional regulator
MREWLNEIEFEDLLTGDMQLIHEQCGIDVLLALMEKMDGLSLYISGKPATEAKKRYVLKFYDGKNGKTLALKLNVSERFIFKTLEAARKANSGDYPEQLKLF